MSINMLIAALFVAAVFLAVFRNRGAFAPLVGTQAQTPAAPSTQTKTKWWDIRSLKGKLGKFATPGSPIRNRWISSRVRVGQVSANWFSMGLILWAVHEQLPIYWAANIQPNLLVVLILAASIGVLGVGVFRGVYGHVICPKNYLRPVLFGLTVYLLFRLVVVNLAGAPLQ